MKINGLQNQEPEQEVFPQILSAFAAKYFTGENEKILDTIVSQLSLTDIEKVVEEAMPGFISSVDVNNLSLAEIEQADLIGMGKSIYESINLENLNSLTAEQLRGFENTFTKCFHDLLHDVAFPVLAIENPHAAVSVKNLLKRVFSAMDAEGIDASTIQNELDIENLPVKSSMALVQRLGARFPGFEDKNDFDSYADKKAIETEESAVSSIIYCDLTTDQAIYLGYILQTEYFVLKKWKPFVHLLKSNGKRYDSIIVGSDKRQLGLLFSVLDALHKKKNSLDERYLRTDGQNGIWPFFQQYFMESADKFFEIPLRRIFSENKDENKAQKIVDSILDPAKQIEISKRVKEITNK